MTILCVGIDLAKNVFALHGVNEAGKAELTFQRSASSLRERRAGIDSLTRPRS